MLAVIDKGLSFCAVDAIEGVIFDRGSRDLGDRWNSRICS